jgi:hypothetical protein
MPSPSLLGLLSPRTSERIAESAARVRVGYPFWLRPFVMRGVLAITLGRRIYLAPRMLDRAHGEVEKLLRHELAHVRQVGRLGLIRFLMIYVRDYFRLRRSGLAPQQAYALIPFEVEACDAERDDEATTRSPEDQPA